MDMQLPQALSPQLRNVIDTMQGWLDGEPVWPYDRIIKTWGSDFEMYRRRWSREIDWAIEAGAIEFKKNDFEGMMLRARDLYMLRHEWVGRFGFAIPCAELLDELAKAEHVVEVGAGTGYMTRLMRHRGIDVTGSDPGDAGYSFMPGILDNQQVGAEAKTMVRRYPTSTVFCSWPTLKATWFRQMLKAMQIGQRLVVIREDACAEETAWQYLDDCFDMMVEIDIPTFEHMNDFAGVYIKKRNRKAS